MIQLETVSSSRKDKSEMTDSEATQARPVRFGVLVAGDKDVGKERDSNEDNFLCEPKRGLFLVCDGMGGMRAGEQASQEAIATLDRLLTPEALERAGAEGETAMETLLREALREADETIKEIAQQHFSRRGMGCTVVAGVLCGARLYVASYGDSRGYLLREECVPILLTEDHSTAAELVRMGTFTPQEARHHMLRNRLSSALGHLDEDSALSFNWVTLSPGDQVVLCSDGLWDMIDGDEIQRITLSAENPETAVRDLIGAANAEGGHDNITAIVLKATGEAATPPEMPARPFVDPYRARPMASADTVRRSLEQTSEAE
jgi:protein phosphatase